MRILGIAVQKDALRYAVLEGTKTAPLLFTKGRVKTADPNDVPALMAWYNSEFRRLITEFKPDQIAYKLTLKPRLEQLHTLAFPFGNLNLIASENGIRIDEYSSSAIRPSKLGLPPKTNLYELVDSQFGQHPPHWDKLQKEAILVSWFQLV